jgi:hypothetical protein
MNKKVVLIIDENKQRTERLDFIVRLGGYETQSFDSDAVALNWVRYAGQEEKVLCVLFNNPGDVARVEQICQSSIESEMFVPVVLVQRGHYSFLAIDKKEHFFTCEPEGVMQTLDILSAIEYDEIEWPRKTFQANGGAL